MDVATAPRKPATPADRTARAFLGPGVIMVLLHARAVAATARIGGMTPLDAIICLLAAGMTVFYVALWATWRAEKRRKGARGARLLAPLIVPFLVPMALVGFALSQPHVSTDPYAVLEESARTGCNLGGTEWGGVRGNVGLLDTAAGEIVFVHNVARDHSEAVVRVRPGEADASISSMVFDEGGDVRADRMLCFLPDDPTSARVRNIATGERSATPAEERQLTLLAQG